MSDRGYWDRIRAERMGRRSLMGAGARAAVGAAGMALVGCGSDEDQQQAQQAQPAPAAAAQQPQQQQEQPAPQEQQAEPQTAPSGAIAYKDDGVRKKGGVLRAGWANGSPAIYLAPYAASPDTVFYPALWDTLTKYDSEGLNPQPHLAESWEFNDDQTMLMVKLRPGLEFHNGKPMTAEEVRKSLERMDDEDVANSQVRSIYNKYVSEVTAVDDTTLQFDLAWPGTTIFDVFQWAQIHDADDIEGLEGLVRVNGSGPFKWDPDAYEVDVYSRADRFENFYEPANLDAIEWHIFQDSDSMSLALQNGEIDLTHHLPKAFHAGLNPDPDYNLQLAPPTGSIWVLGMVGTGRGGGHPMMDDPTVRRALYRCIDRKRITEELFEGLASVKNVVWPSFSPAYDESLDVDYFDLDEAKRLISEAGYPDGTPTLPIACQAAREEGIQIAQIIQSDAAKAGINVEPQRIESATWIEQFLAGTHEAMYVSFYGFYALHPQSLPVMNFQMRIPNSCAYETPHYQAMIDGWPTADSEAKRQQLLDDFNKILDEEPWVSPISTTVQIWAMQSNVKNLWYDITGIPRMHHVYFDG